jgi:hypothetical protein
LILLICFGQPWKASEVLVEEQEGWEEN